MSDFSITEAAFSGMRVLGRHTLCAFVWAAISIGTFALLVTLFGGSIVNLISMIAQHGGKPDPALIVGMIGSIGVFYLLLIICSIVLNGVISCAVYRAEIYPADSRFFYLRFGASEGWVMLVSFVRGVVIFLVQMAFLVPITIISVAVGAVGVVGASHAQAAAGGMAAYLLVNGVLRLIMYGVIIWVYLRLSLAGPMTFVERKFRLFESWALTRGHVSRLFVVGLLVFAVGMAVYAILGVVGFAGGFAIWGGFPHPSSLQAFVGQSPDQIVRFLAPYLEWALVLFFIGAVVMMPISLSPWAHVYKRMKPETDVAKVFE